MKRLVLSREIRLATQPKHKDSTKTIALCDFQYALYSDYQHPSITKVIKLEGARVCVCVWGLLSIVVIPPRGWPPQVKLSMSLAGMTRPNTFVTID